MPEVLPGATPEVALRYLRESLHELGPVRNAYSQSDALSEYQRWANHWARTFGTAMCRSDVERLITSQRYWLLQGQGVAVGHGGLRDLVDLEVDERTAALEAEIAGLAAASQRWALGTVAAIVLDTSVLLEHSRDIVGLDWNTLADERGDVALVLVIPMAVIRELDNHKRSRAKAPDGTLLIRTQASLALKQIGHWSPTGGERLLVRPAGDGEELGRRSDTYVSLLLDPAGHRPSLEADGEILDRASGLAAFSDRTYLATYDRALALGARRTGLRPIEFEYAE